MARWQSLGLKPPQLLDAKDPIPLKETPESAKRNRAQDMMLLISLVIMAGIGVIPLMGIAAFIVIWIYLNRRKKKVH